MIFTNMQGPGRVESKEPAMPNRRSTPAFLATLNRLFGVLPGTFRLAGCARERPVEILELYSYEGCPACRRVRRKLTELDLDFVHRSCPRGDSPKREALAARGGKVQVPFLVDANTGTELYESRAIVAYLEEVYGQASAHQN
jgi:glutaredoxin